MKNKRRVIKNWALRQELIDKAFIIPAAHLPGVLKARGFLEAAAAAKRELINGRKLFWR